LKTERKKDDLELAAEICPECKNGNLHIVPHDLHGTPSRLLACDGCFMFFVASRVNETTIGLDPRPDILRDMLELDAAGTLDLERDVHGWEILMCRALPGEDPVEEKPNTGPTEPTLN
jgi:hypothetical protein